MNTFFEWLDRHEIDSFYPLWIVMNLVVGVVAVWWGPEFFASATKADVQLQAAEARGVTFLAVLVIAGVGCFGHWLSKPRPMSSANKDQLKIELGLPLSADEWDLAQAMTSGTGRPKPR